LRFRFELPLSDLAGTPLGALLRGKLTRSDFRNITMETWEKTDRFAVVKPQRKLGATWMDDFFAQGLLVSLCSDCTRMYGHWWRQVHYLPNLELNYADCDGCSLKLVAVTQFRPEEPPLTPTQ